MLFTIWNQRFISYSSYCVGVIYDPIVYVGIIGRIKSRAFKINSLPPFSGSLDSTESTPTSDDVERYPKRKMATAKPEVVIPRLS
jgi:hypothetical protein